MELSSFTEDSSLADRLRNWQPDNPSQSLDYKEQKSVLIVEDDTTAVFLLKLALNKTGSFAAFDWVSNAKEALKHISQRSENGHKKPYDLIIIDVYLEGRETGLDLWDALAKQNMNVLPVLVTSSISEGRFSELVAASKFTPRYLRKPFKVESCAKVISDLLSQPVRQ